MSANRCVCTHERYGPRSCTSTNNAGGSHRLINVRHPSDTPQSRSPYSISVPARITIGSGVRVRKRSSGGVIASRFEASAKKAKTRSRGTDSTSDVSITPPSVIGIRRTM